MMHISPLNKNTLAFIQAKIDNKTKPLGALGALEQLALQLALITEQRHQKKSSIDSFSSDNNSVNQISIKSPVMLVFAADHGINEESVSIAPSAVTKQMVLNFLHGGAAINCFCQSNDITLSVIDCGILQPIGNDERPLLVDDKANKVELIEQRLGSGTDNFSEKPAMSMTQIEQGFEYAQQLVKTKVEQGVELLLLGEMGIANTSSAAALMSALTSMSVDECVGRGTGITDEQLDKKITLIEKAIRRISALDYDTRNLTQKEVLTILAELGGFEIVQMVSAILSGASMSIPVVIDGFIVTVAALVAQRLNENVADYLIFSHVSQEKAHQALLEELMAAQTFSNISSAPLLSLGLRLGEGTGAALSLPLIKASASFYNHMASFESAGVTV
jgi:nicotinate-nucleotide--dimethylbenzimidazole phosphoribosyltransferase